MMKASGGKAVIDIYEDIGSWGISSADFKRELRGYGKLSEIELSINSYGGVITDGFAMYNDLKETGANITVTIKGIAASIASYLAMAGNYIKSHENSFLHIHNPSVWMIGGSDDLRREADVMDEMKDSIIKAYMTHAKGLSYEEISRMMDETTYLNAKRALELGFIDEILDPIEIEEPETNTNIIIPENYKRLIFTNRIQPVKPVNKGGKMNCPICGKHELADGQEMCFDCAVKKEREEAKAAEKVRIKNINAICRASNLSDDFINYLVDSGKTVDQCSSEIAEEIKKANDKGFVNPERKLPEVIKDESDKFREHAVNSLSVVAGLEKDPQKINDMKKDQPINGLHSLMRRSLALKGVDTLSMNPDQLYRSTFTNMSTGDIPAILADVANKSLAAGYKTYGPTFQAWCGTRTVSDFKEVKIIKMSDFSDIDDMPEGSRFKLGKFADKQERASVSTKGKAVVISREMFINDDLDSITKGAALMSASMGRRLNRDVYSTLTSNNLDGPAMLEVANMFADGNGNKATGAAAVGAPSVATIAATETLLLTQKSPKPSKDSPDVFLNVPARYLITGTNNRVRVLQLLMTPYDVNSAIPGVYNPYANNIIPVFDPYLQSLLTNAEKEDGWYLAADPNVLESIGVAYLNGYTTPTIRSDYARADEALGLTYTIFFDYGVYASDYRGIAFNPAKETTSAS